MMNTYNELETMLEQAEAVMGEATGEALAFAIRDRNEIFRRLASIPYWDDNARA
jgi:dsDNA-binding SOS-regulon protein